MDLKGEAMRIVRRAAKGAGAMAFPYTGAEELLASVQRRAVGGRRVLILSYHRVVGNFDLEATRSLPTLNIAQETFKKHLEPLAEDYEAVTLDRALEVLEGKARPARDVAVITFDDGYRDVYDHAFPVMREMRLPGIVYVPSAFTGTNRRIAHDRLWSALSRMKDRRLGPVSVGAPGRFESMLIDAWEGAETPNKVLENLISNNPTPVLYDLAAALEDRLGLSEKEAPMGQLPMSWEMLRELQAHGIEIGAHTAEHTVLTNQPLDEARREIAQCKAVLEKERNGGPRKEEGKHKEGLGGLGAAAPPRQGRRDRPRVRAPAAAGPAPRSVVVRSLQAGGAGPLERLPHAADGAHREPLLLPAAARRERRGIPHAVGRHGDRVRRAGRHRRLPRSLRARAALQHAGARRLRRPDGDPRLHHDGNDAPRAGAARRRPGQALRGDELHLRYRPRGGERRSALARVRSARLLLGVRRARHLALRRLRRPRRPPRRCADRLEAVPRPARVCLAVRRRDPLRYAAAQPPPLGGGRSGAGRRLRHLRAGLLPAPHRESALSTDQRGPAGAAQRARWTRPSRASLPRCEPEAGGDPAPVHRLHDRRGVALHPRPLHAPVRRQHSHLPRGSPLRALRRAAARGDAEIGRASCRERV